MYKGVLDCSFFHCLRFIVSYRLLVDIYIYISTRSHIPIKGAYVCSVKHNMLEHVPSKMLRPHVCLRYKLLDPGVDGTYIR
jgi:hypothetical protein